VTYIAPLSFVLLVTMGKEAYDDYKRNLRDREANSARYLVLASSSSLSSPSDDDDLSHSLLEGNLPPTRSVPSSSIRVGDLVLLEKNQRLPADLVLLRTSDSSGTCFIRTDQLDGETDWKLRVAVPATQKLPSDQELLNLDAEIYGAFLKGDCFPCALILLFSQRMRPARTFTHSLAHSRSTRRPACPRTTCPWFKCRRSSHSQQRTCYGRTPCLLRAPLLALWSILGQRHGR
jgi:magnesium-transporting ATPase (P-type)